VAVAVHRKQVVEAMVALEVAVLEAQAQVELGQTEQLTLVVAAVQDLLLKVTVVQA
jgi:hypothetical protein